MLMMNVYEKDYFKLTAMLQSKDEEERFTSLCPRKALMHDQNLKSAHERVRHCEILEPEIKTFDKLETDYPLAFSILVHR